MPEIPRDPIRTFPKELRASGALLVSALALTGCGGSGSIASVSSVPGPVAAATGIQAPGEVPSPVEAQSETTYATVIGDPLPPTPALTTGSYDAIAVAQLSETGGYAHTTKLVPTGALEVAVDHATNTYALSFDPAVFPNITLQGGDGGQLEFQISDPAYGHFYQSVTRVDGEVTSTYSSEGKDGEVWNNLVDEPWFDSSVGKSHVSLGKWSWPWQGLTGTGDWIDGSVVFVYGDRTPAGAIPTSGTASYQVTDRMLSGYQEANNYGPANLDILLRADFGAQSIGADVRYDTYVYGGDGYHFDLSGAAPIDPNGSFDIALNGTMQVGTSDDNWLTYTPGPNPAVSAPSGEMMGAFFGPSGEQIGATMMIPGFSDGDSVLSDGEMLGLGFIAVRQ